MDRSLKSEIISQDYKLDDKLYRVLIDNAPEAVVVLDVETGKFIDFNQNAVDLFQLTPDELRDSGPSDLSPDIVFGQNSEKYAMSFVEEALNGSNPVFDWFHIDKGGNKIPCEVRLLRLPIFEKQLVRGSIIDKRKEEKLEVALNETEERLQLALKTAGLGFYDWSPQNGELHWDNRMKEIFEIPDGCEDYNEYFFKTLHPDDRPLVQSNMERILDPSCPDLSFKDSYRVEIKDKTKHVQTIGSVFRNEFGIVTRIIGTTQDITHAKIAEQEAKKNNELFKVAFDQQFQFMAILSPNGKIIEMNDLALKAQDLSREDLVDLKFWDSPCWKNLPEMRERIKQQVLGTLKQDEPIVAEDIFQSHDGVFHYALASYSSVKNKDGSVRFLLVQATEITQRKIALEQLQKTQEELSLITNRFKTSTKAAKVGIFDWDLQKNELIWDETMLELYKAKNKRITRLYDFWRNSVHLDDLGNFEQEIQLALNGEQDFNLEFRIVWPDESIRFIKALSIVEKDSNGVAIRMVGTNWDITKEKEAEQEKLRSRQLELRNRELEQFAYVASHDLQEPLRTVISFVELFKKGYQHKLDDNADELLAFISNAAMRMNKLIKGLLEYSRIGRNEELTMVDCNQLMNVVMDDLSMQIEEASVSIDVKKLPWIKGFRTELRILFQNLISNAIKFGKKDAPVQIKVSAEKIKTEWIFCVADNGIGISPKYHGKIFSIFQRLHAADEYEGTGIGLAHAQRIVELHHGKIWLKSEENKGSKFYFSIPL